MAGGWNRLIRRCEGDSRNMIKRRSQDSTGSINSLVRVQLQIMENEAG
jgi:hypothetical protein